VVSGIAERVGAAFEFVGLPLQLFGDGSSSESIVHRPREVTYQPASRYWPFQWYETGLFLALARPWPADGA
jgi:hypothetical protein